MILLDEEDIKENSSNECVKLFGKREYRKAIDCFAKEVVKSKDITAMDSLVLCYYKLNDLEGLINYLEERICINAKMGYEMTLLEDVLVKRYGKEKYLSALEQLILNFELPDEIKYELLVDNSLIKSEPTLALRQNKILLKLNPKNLKAYLNMGEIFIQFRQYDESLAWLKKAQKIDPNCIDIYTGLAFIYHAKGNKGKALDYYIKAVQIDPENVSANMYLDLYLTDNEEIDFEEKEEKKQANELFKKIWGYYDSGLLKVKMSDLEGAITDFTKSIDLCNNQAFSDLYCKRGFAKKALGDSKGAKLDLKKAMEIDPSIFSNYLKEGLQDFHKGNFQKAIEQFTNAIILYPKADEAYFYRAKTNLKLGRKSEACSDFKKAADLGMTGALDLIDEHCRK